MQNITNLIVAIAVAAIPVIGAWVTKEILANSKSTGKAKKALDVLEVISELAEDAVTAAEKGGADNGLSGNEKKDVAIKVVTTSLSNLGITSASQSQIAAAVEKAYMQFKQAIEATYPMPEPKPAELPQEDAGSAEVSEMTPAKAADIAAQLGEIKQMIANSNATPATPEAKVEG